MVIDLRRKCRIPQCPNLGQYHQMYTRKTDSETVIARRPLCVKHRRIKRGAVSRKSNRHHKSFKRDFCDRCEYCDWIGPCDVHRPNPGGYVLGNMRSACPNCHRLISMGLVKDKFQKAQPKQEEF